MALTDSLVSYWKLDESSGNASDSVGSNTLTNNNTVTYSSGKINNGANFASASSQYLSVTDNASLSIIGNMTIAGWVYIATQPSDVYYVIASKYLGTGNQRSFEFRYGDVSGTKKFEFRNSPDGTGASTTIGTLNYASLATTTWTHIAMTYVASTGVVTIYANGTSIGTITSMATSIFDSTALFGLGGNNNGDGDYLNGSLDETGIWNRALSAGEVSQLYSGGNGIAYSFSGVDNIIAYDATSQGTYGASPLTFAHTCTGTNRILFVNTITDTDTVTGVTYGGVAMTLIAKSTYPGAGRKGTSLFYLIAPTSGTNNIVITASSGSVGGAGISYTGAKQTGQPDSSNTKAQGSSEATMAIATTVVASNCWEIATSCDNQGSGGTGLNGAVVKQTSGQGMIFGDSNAIVSTGSQTITFDFAGANGTYGAVAASIASAATSASTNSNFLMFMN